MPSPSSSLPARRGVTLLELLVVLLLMALSAVLVLPSLSPLGAASEDGPRAAVIASARRAAIRRGEALRLRMDADGVWALVAQRDGALVDGGRLPHAKDRAPRVDAGTWIAEEGLVLTITALGSCIPLRDGSNSANAPMSAERFDVLGCTWMRDAASALPRTTPSAR